MGIFTFIKATQHCQDKPGCGGRLFIGGNEEPWTKMFMISFLGWRRELYGIEQTEATA